MKKKDMQLPAQRHLNDIKRTIEKINQKNKALAFSAEVRALNDVAEKK